MITKITCHKATDSHHALNFLYNGEEYEYNLETPMLMEFGLIHCCGAVKRFIESTSSIFGNSEITEIANKEIEALDACANAIAAKKKTNQTH